MSPQIVDLARPVSAEELAVVIGASWSLFGELIDPAKKAGHYKHHRIPKRRPNGGATHRDVWECASDEVATVHKTLSRRLQQFIPTRCAFPSPIAHGYVGGRSTVTHALPHAGSAVLLRVDIADFFQTITRSRLGELLAALGMQAGAVTALCELCTIDGRLPLGLHASPTLANLACLSLDAGLTALAAASGTRVTRYADDIAFSGSMVPTLEQVSTLLEAEGFKISESKCRTTKRGQAHYLTGLSVSETSPRLPRIMKRRIRQELHFATKYGLASHLGRTGDTNTQSGVNRIAGTLCYFNAVEPSLAATLQARWQTILTRENVGPAYSPRALSARAPVTLLVDETDIDSPDGPVLAISMALVVELAQVQTALQTVARRHLVDPYSTGDKDYLDTKGLHHSDASEDLRTSVFNVLEFLPVRGYVAYDLLSAPEAYQSTYERLVRSLLRHRLMFCDGAEVSLVFEENSKLSLTALENLARGEFDRLASTNDRRPKSTPTVRFGTKHGDPCLAASDFLLAAFRQYAIVELPTSSTGKKKQQPGEQARKRFERLRDKIRLIQGLPTQQSFSRKLPFEPWPLGRPTLAATSIAATRSPGGSSRSQGKP